MVFIFKCQYFLMSTFQHILLTVNVNGAANRKFSGDFLFCNSTSFDNYSLGATNKCADSIVCRPRRSGCL